MLIFFIRYFLDRFYRLPAAANLYLIDPMRQKLPKSPEATVMLISLPLNLTDMYSVEDVTVNGP